MSRHRSTSLSHGNPPIRFGIGEIRNDLNDQAILHGIIIRPIISLILIIGILLLINLIIIG